MHGQMMDWKVEQSGEDFGDLQAAVLHPLYDHKEGHAERVNVKQSAEDYGGQPAEDAGAPHAAVAHPEHAGVAHPAVDHPVHDLVDGHETGVGVE